MHRRDRPAPTAAEELAAAAAAADHAVAGLEAPLDRAQLTTALLQDIAALQRRVAALRMAAVAELRALGWSYRAIGASLGLSANAITQIEKQRLRHGEDAGPTSEKQVCVNSRRVPPCCPARTDRRSAPEPGAS